MVTLVNRAKMSTSTTGTGTITLGSAEAGYQSFVDAGVTNGDVVRYVIEDGDDWEIGSGTYTASGTTLSRTVDESSNSDAALNLTGSAVVFITAAAEDVAGGDRSVDFNDNVKARFGTGNDLEIYHDGTTNNSYIKETNASGHLIIQGQEIQFDNAAGTSLMNLSASQIEMLHNGSTKLETTLSGIQTTGTVNVNGAYTLPTSDGTNGQVLTTDGSGAVTFVDAGGIAYTRHTANVTMAAKEGVIADTSGGAFTVTLPATPATGDTVVITDGADWATTNLTVGRNGSTIEGDAADMTMDIGGVAVQFTYDGTTWQIYTQLGAAGGNVVSEGDSPTFAGLTVDTDTLYVDAANNRVGIGKTSPATALDVDGVVTATSYNGDGSALTGISGTPTGTVIYHAANTAPTGFVKANGASLNTTTYADLFAVIGYTFGGSGSSFNVPDLRGEFMRGWDDSRGVDSGRSFGSAQSWAIENIVGTFTDIRTRLNTQFTTSGAFTGSTGLSSGDNGSGGANTVNFDFDASRVVNTASETRPRNVAILACIKY